MYLFIIKKKRVIYLTISFVYLLFIYCFRGDINDYLALFEHRAACGERLLSCTFSEQNTT